MYLEKFPELGWISALRSASIRQLPEKGYLSISLFDTRNIAEIFWPMYPNERFIACFNPLLAEERRRKRKERLAYALKIPIQKLIETSASDTFVDLVEDIDMRT